MSGPLRFGSYELVQRIAEGGMAEVWRATSRGAAGFEKTVVIKRVLPELMQHSQLADLLVREAKIAARLGHANIVQIFDLGEQDGAYFIAMEHIDGRDLGALMLVDQRLRPRGQGLPLPIQLWMIAEAGKALDYAHRRKGDDGRPLLIVHRDISPQNILVGFEGEVKVTDFGIAHADQLGLGKGEDPKVLRGKYAYMSPEQAHGEPLDRRSDLFSLGIVLWELVTGQRLFKGATPQDTLALVRTADVPVLDCGPIGAPPQLAAICAKALARERDDRYGSAGELVADLTKLLYEMGESVDESSVAEQMERLFPRAEDEKPNKLRVDLLMRAEEDATRTGFVVDDTDPAGHLTAVGLKQSRKVHAEDRRIALLLAPRRPGDGDLVARAAEEHGGLALGDLDGEDGAPFVVVAFGHAGTERAAEQALRAALEARRRAVVDGVAKLDPAPPMAVVAAQARVFAGAAVTPEPEAERRGMALARQAASGEVLLEPQLVSEVSRTFRVARQPEAQAMLVDGFRTRHEREALSLRRGPFFGRRAELQQLSEALLEAGEGRGSALLVLGEPGSGKSRLMAELRTRLDPKEVAFFSARGPDGEADRSFGAFSELVMDLCGVEDEDTPRERFAKVDRLRVLGLSSREVRLLGELLGLRYPVAREDRAGRPRGIELALILRRALRALARERTVVLGIEDVQWLDDATRQVLPLLVSGLEHTRVLTVLTVRPGGVMPRVDGPVLDLRALDAEAAAKMLAHGLGAETLDARLAAFARDEAAGNPGWIELLAALLRGRVHHEGTVAVLDRAEPVDPPRATRTVIATRVAQLRQEEAEALRVVAIWGTPVTMELLAFAIGAPLDTAERIVERLLLKRLLTVVERPQSIPPPHAWTHPQRPAPATAGLEHGQRVTVAAGLVRRAIAESVSEVESRRLHGSVARALERNGIEINIEALAWHSARSSDRRRAPDYLLAAAGRSEARGDLQSAALRHAEAARIVREEADDPSGERLVQISVAGAKLAHAVGDLALADELVSEAWDSARGDLAAEATLTALRARSSLSRGEVEHAVSSLLPLRAFVEGARDPLLRARALAEVGGVLADAGRVAEAREVLRAAEPLLRGEPLAHGRLLCALARTSAAFGQGDEARETVARALAAAARTGDARSRYEVLEASADVLDLLHSPLDAAERYVEAALVARDHGREDEEARLVVRGALSRVLAGQRAVAQKAVDAPVRNARGEALREVLRAVLGATDGLPAALAALRRVPNLADAPVLALESAARDTQPA